MVYQLRLRFDTWLKQATVQGSSLLDSQRQFIDGGTVLPLSGFELTDNHLRVTLGKDEQGEQIFYKGRNTWFVYEPAVELLRNGQVVDPTTQDSSVSAYTMQIELDTWLKQSTAQGSSLPDDQRQLVRAGTSLPVTSFTVAGTFHLQVALGVDEQGRQVSFKGKTTWYVYRPVVELVKNDDVVVVPPPPPIRGEKYTLAFLEDTLLKRSTAQGSTLPESDKHFVGRGNSLPIQQYEVADASHWRVLLGLDANGKQVLVKGRTTWYVYRPAVELLKDGVPVEKSLVGKTVVLDPGHGEFSRGVNDPGAVNRRLNRNERDEVRKQANIIQRLLGDKGATVRVIENNTSLSLRAIGSQARGADCFVSLHLNAVNQQVQGHEVFVSRPPTSADVRLANAVNQSLDGSFADGDVPNRGVKQRRLAVFEAVPLATAAILTEAFFIDSVRSAGTLDRWNDEAARAIAQGIERFLTA